MNVQEWNSDNTQLYRETYHAAAIKLQEVETVPYVVWDDKTRQGVNMHAGKGYKLVVNGQDTGLYVHKSVVTPQGEHMTDKLWHVTLESGLYAVDFFNVELTSRKKAVAMAYAFHAELCKVGVNERDSVTLSNKTKHKGMLMLKKSSIYQGYRLITEPDYKPSLGY